MISGAPSLVEQEATLGLKRLSEEAEALLLSEGVLRGPAGRCRAAAPRLTALQIGG